MSATKDRPAGTRTDAGWGERTLLGPPPRTGDQSRSGTRSEPKSKTPVGRAGSRSRRPRSSARRVPFALLLLGVIAGGMCALLALNTATAASEVRERKIDATNASLNANEEQLSRAVAAMQAPGQLALMATRLGLVPAGSPAFLRINDNGTVTVLGHPGAIVAPPKPLTAAQLKAQAAQKKIAVAKAALAAKTKAAKTKAAKDKAAKAAKAARASAAQAKTAKGKAGPKATPTSTPTGTPSSTAPSTPSSPKPHATSTPRTPAPTPVPTVTVGKGPR